MVPVLGTNAFKLYMLQSSCTMWVWLGGTGLSYPKAERHKPHRATDLGITGELLVNYCSRDGGLQL